MDKISGIILDVYDDLGGSVLKTIFPTADALPEFVKSAHAISFDERSALPDDAFALIIEQGGVELKKFATIDAGNTALSVEYFLKTAHKLPEEAQKVAAQNLVAACGWYDIEAPEELQKIATLPPKATGFLGRTGELLAGSRLGMHKAEVQAAKENLEYHLSGTHHRTTFGADGKPTVTEHLRGGPKHIGDATLEFERAKVQRSKELGKVWGSRGLAGGAAVAAASRVLKKKEPSTEKVAFGVGTALNLAMVPGSVGEVRSNQQKQRAFQSQTGTIATPNQLAGM